MNYKQEGSYLQIITRRKLDAAVSYRHLYSPLQVELEVFVVNGVHHLWEKRTIQRLTALKCETVVLVTELYVLCVKHLSLNIH